MARRTGDGKPNENIAVAVHGGAGTLPRLKLTPRREAQYQRALERALRAGYAVLEQDGTSLDAVVAAPIGVEAPDRSHGDR